MAAEVRDPRFHSVVGGTAELQPWAAGSCSPRGRSGIRPENYLLFSDMPGNIIRRWTQAGGVTPFRQPSNMTNGLTYDRQGRLLACEHATSRVTRTEPDGSITVLATHYEGKELNSPNDIVVGATVRSTSPIRCMAGSNITASRASRNSFRGVYRIDPTGWKAHAPRRRFSPAERALLLARRKAAVHQRHRARSYPRLRCRRGRRLRGGEVFAETKGEGEGAPDGMKIDSGGNVYCCGPGGVHVFDPEGVSLGVIRTPEPTANFAFGGDDYRTLFVCASSTVFPGLSWCRAGRYSSATCEATGRRSYPPHAADGARPRRTCPASAGRGRARSF